MPKKTIKKRKAYARNLRDRVTKGEINAPSGEWMRYNPTLAMHRDQHAGYKL